MSKLKYIVTGTGRCGTVYFAKLLTSLGINCGHETIFTHEGIVEAKRRLEQVEPLRVSLISEMASAEEEWFPEGISDIQGDSSYMAAPFLDDPVLDGVKIIHVIRQPMEVINSFINGLGYFRNDCLNREFLRNYHRFIYSHVPGIQKYKNPVDRAAMYYIEWNKMIERNAEGKPYLRHDINRSLRKVFEFLEVGNPTKYYNNSKSNHILGLERELFHFKQIPSGDVREQIISLHKNYFYIKI